MNSSNFPDDSDYSGLHFFNKTASVLPVNIDTARRIASQIEKKEECRFHLIEIVFVDEHKIKALNREHLKRNYITDIITFRYDGDSLNQQSNQQIEGTLYCCTPRIRGQAKEYSETTEAEFKRIIIHGLLHLIGYDDQSKTERKKMRQKENFYLQKLAAT
jgi:rRNA maturation RNase YbeY